MCKPTKSTEGEDYEDDVPFDEEEDDEDEDVDDPGIVEAQPKMLSESMSFRELVGSTVILPCNVINTGLQNNDPYHSSFSTR